MSVAAREFSPFQIAKGAVLIFISLAGVVCGMTMLYMGMRSVMQIGGACAEGGAFEIRVPCPEGVPMLMIGGIWGGVIFLGIYIWQSSKYKVPSFALLAWPALFLSLGWNFLEYGVNPPIGEGPVWGWLICGILFALMGGLPLLAVLPMMIKGLTKSDDVDLLNRPLAAPRALRDVASRSRPPRSSSDVPLIDPPTPVDDGDHLVSKLERLSTLHREGALSDIEFEAAKQSLLRGKS